MPSASGWEPKIFAVVAKAITEWLTKVRQAVFGNGRAYPDPSAITATTPDWIESIQSDILPALEQVAQDGWTDQAGKGVISLNGFVASQLAITENLLVRLSDEVYNRIFEQITIGHTNGETVDQIADRIDAVLFFTGSEWWPNRAKTIAVTETHRAWQAGTLAAALYYEPATGESWIKVWVAEDDDKTRPSHRRADGQRRILSDTFTVGGVPMMYPGDPAAPGDEVINCRCDMSIQEGRR